MDQSSTPNNKTAGQSRPAFSHPTEDFFARVLDAYGIEWQYEPRTFPLEWDTEGRIIEAFAPDFYLPQQDLFIELTTRRPKLNNFKNQKVRRLQELYPEIQIKLFKRRDLRNMMVKFGMEEDARKMMGTDALNESKGES